jgi:hypothetical protein
MIAAGGADVRRDLSIGRMVDDEADRANRIH